MALLNDFDEISTSWLRSSCLWPLSTRPEPTAKRQLQMGDDHCLRDQDLAEKVWGLWGSPSFSSVSQDDCFCSKPNKLHFIAHSVQVPLTTVKNCRRLPPTAHFTSNNGAPREVRKWRLGCWKAEQKSWLTHRAEELKLDSKTCWGFCSQPKRPPSHQ